MARKLVKKDNTIYEILEILSYSTEISPKIFHNQKRGYKVYMNEVAKMTNTHTYFNEKGEMVENIKVLTIIGSGQYKTIRLRLKAFEENFLLLLSEEIHERYLVNSYHKYQSHYNVDVIKRNHTLSELYMMFKENNIIDGSLSDEPLLKNTAINNGIFINNRLIKSFYPSKAIKNQGRSYGLLLYPQACHTVYYYKSVGSYWSNESEKKNKFLTQKIVSDLIMSLKKQPNSFYENAVILSPDNQVANDLLLNPKSTTSLTMQGLKLNNIYQYFRYINIKYIDEMLYVLKNEPFIKEKIKYKMFGENAKTNQIIECDGRTDDRRYWLFVFDFNLTRIQRFKKSIDYYENELFGIYGFDWQKEYLLTHFNDERVEVFTIDFNQLIEILKE